MTRWAAYYFWTRCDGEILARWLGRQDSIYNVVSGRTGWEMYIVKNGIKQKCLTLHVFNLNTQSAICLGLTECRCEHSFLPLHSA